MLYLIMFSVTQDYVAWNGGVISKQQTGNNAGGSGSSIVGGIIKATAWMNRGKLLEISVSRVSAPAEASSWAPHKQKSEEPRYSEKSLAQFSGCPMMRTQK
jgi:hypothetical protein